MLFVVTSKERGRDEDSRGEWPWHTDAFPPKLLHFFQFTPLRPQTAPLPRPHISLALILPTTHIMAAPQTSQAVRRWIMTAAVAGITITGTIYGAGLKTDREGKQACLLPTHWIYLRVFFLPFYRISIAPQAGSPLIY